MPRNYGRFTTDIWRDEKFRALSGTAQRLYFMLGTQSDISAAGTLPLTLRRWSQYATDTPPDALSDALSELQDKRFVYTDFSTEEVLVRSFVKWDGGIQNDKRRPVVLEAAEAIASPELRGVLAVELRELGVTDALSDSPSDSPSDATYRFDRVVVKEGEYNLNPLTTTLEGEPFDAESGEPPAEFCSKHPSGTEGNCGPCGTARRRRKAWDAAAPERRRRALAVAADCDRCGGTGWIEDADGSPVRKCDHRRNA